MSEKTVTVRDRDEAGECLDDDHERKLTEVRNAIDDVLVNGYGMGRGARIDDAMQALDWDGARTRHRIVSAHNEAIELAARMAHRGVDDDALVDRIRNLKRSP